MGTNYSVPMAVILFIYAYGIAWDVNMTVSDAMLYRIGKSVPLTAADFRNFAAHRVINVAEAAEILGCSRQNIIDLTKRGKLHPIKTSEKSTLYLKSEILKRNWQWIWVIPHYALQRSDIMGYKIFWERRTMKYIVLVWFQYHALCRMNCNNQTLRWMTFILTLICCFDFFFDVF